MPDDHEKHGLYYINSYCLTKKINMTPPAATNDTEVRQSKRKLQLKRLCICDCFSKRTSPKLAIALKEFLVARQVSIRHKRKSVIVRSSIRLKEEKYTSRQTCLQLSWF